MFNLEIGRIVDWVCGGGFSSVALQLPEGLKSKAIDISDIITRETGASVFILGYPCYGATFPGGHLLRRWNAIAGMG
jgi:2-(3-amino-3-carboxypropyl)histidine synthase